MTTPAAESRPLPSGAEKDIGKVAAWLLSTEANFQTVDHVTICKNIGGLATVTSDLSELFAGEIKKQIPGRMKPVQTRVTAIHFDRPTVIPLKQGWVMELIVIPVVNGAVVVGDQPFAPNSYFHITDQAQVSGDFFGVLLLSQLSHYDI
ncbi:hypothetical protein HD806DRAFT_541054 [Xylariaceae sp. AK1471]|nr:hypothetical protein HD806DRAFT_541054 [Xylariaceae sp. AK1471]